MMTQNELLSHISLPSNRIRVSRNRIALKPYRHSMKSSFELIISFKGDKMLFFYGGGRYTNKVDALDSCLSGTTVAEIFNGKIGGMH